MDKIFGKRYYSKKVITICIRLCCLIALQFTSIKTLIAAPLWSISLVPGSNLKQAVTLNSTTLV